MKKRLITAVIAVTAVIFLILAVSVFFRPHPLTLELSNSETGKVYRTFAVKEGTEFSVSFIHSVNKSPVTDVFVIRDDKIYVDRTVYSAFGAGVQSTLEPGQKLSYDDDGNMVVSGFGTVFPEVKYIVGTVYDHVLEINGEKISLTELCGRNAHVCFRLR